MATQLKKCQRQHFGSVSDFMWKIYVLMTFYFWKGGNSGENIFLTEHFSEVYQITPA